MNLLRIVSWEVAWYGAWWLCFVVVAFLCARYLRWIGVFIGALVISILIVTLDVHWIFQEMRTHPEDGRDADVGFWFGVLCRVVIFNILLLPVSAIGLWFSARRRGVIESQD